MAKNRYRFGIYLIIVLVVAALIVSAYAIRRKSGITSDTGLSIDPDTVSWSSSIKDEGSGGIKIPGYGDIYFPADETSVQITLYNPEANNCLFAFELYLDDDKEPIAKTGLVEPGKALTEAELSRGLSAGEYVLQIKVNVFSPEGTSLNNAIVKTKLYVV